MNSEDFRRHYRHIWDIAVTRTLDADPSLVNAVHQCGHQLINAFMEVAASMPQWDDRRMAAAPGMRAQRPPLPSQGPVRPVPEQTGRPQRNDRRMAAAPGLRAQRPPLPPQEPTRPVPEQNTDHVISAARTLVNIIEGAMAGQYGSPEMGRDRVARLVAGTMRIDTAIYLPPDTRPHIVRGMAQVIQRLHEADLARLIPNFNTNSDLVVYSHTLRLLRENFPEAFPPRPNSQENAQRAVRATANEGNGTPLTLAILQQQQQLNGGPMRQMVATPPHQFLQPPPPVATIAAVLNPAFAPPPFDSTVAPPMIQPPPVVYQEVLPPPPPAPALLPANNSAPPVLAPEPSPVLRVKAEPSEEETTAEAPEVSRAPADKTAPSVALSVKREVPDGNAQIEATATPTVASEAPTKPEASELTVPPIPAPSAVAPSPSVAFNASRLKREVPDGNAPIEAAATPAEVPEASVRPEASEAAAPPTSTHTPAAPTPSVAFNVCRVKREVPDGNGPIETAAIPAETSEAPRRPEAAEPNAPSTSTPSPPAPSPAVAFNVSRVKREVPDGNAPIETAATPAETSEAPRRPEAAEPNAPPTSTPSPPAPSPSVAFNARRVKREVPDVNAQIEAAPAEASEAPMTPETSEPVVPPTPAPSPVDPGPSVASNASRVKREVRDENTQIEAEATVTPAKASEAPPLFTPSPVAPSTSIAFNVNRVKTEIVENASQTNEASGPVTEDHPRQAEVRGAPGDASLPVPAVEPVHSPPPPVTTSPSPPFVKASLSDEGGQPNALPETPANSRIHEKSTVEAQPEGRDPVQHRSLREWRITGIAAIDGGPEHIPQPSNETDRAMDHPAQPPPTEEYPPRVPLTPAGEDVPRNGNTEIGAPQINVKEESVADETPARGRGRKRKRNGDRDDSVEELHRFSFRRAAAGSAKSARTRGNRQVSEDVSMRDVLLSSNGLNLTPRRSTCSFSQVRVALYIAPLLTLFEDPPIELPYVFKRTDSIYPYFRCNDILIVTADLAETEKNLPVDFPYLIMLLSATARPKLIRGKGTCRPNKLFSDAMAILIQSYNPQIPLSPNVN